MSADRERLLESYINIYKLNIKYLEKKISDLVLKIEVEKHSTMIKTAQRCCDILREERWAESELESIKKAFNLT